MVIRCCLTWSWFWYSRWL